MHELEVAVEALVQRPAFRCDLKFREQITDAAASAARNVAEGFGRYNPGEFARFLDVTRASALEVQACLQRARDAGYIQEPEFRGLYTLVNRGNQATARFQRYLRSSAAKQNAKRFRHSKSRRTFTTNVNGPNGPNDPNDPNE